MSVLEILDWFGGLPAELLLLPPALFLTGIFAVILTKRRGRLSRWHEIAQRTGLRVNERTIVHQPELVGDYRGRRLTMTIVGRQTGSTRLRRTWTLVTADVTNPTSLGLKMYRQDIVDTLLASLGMPDVKVGDPAFDSRFIIQSHEAELTRQLLGNAALRSELIRADVERVEMFSPRLSVYYARDERDGAHALFDAVVHLANAIDSLEKDSRPDIL